MNTKEQDLSINFQEGAETEIDLLELMYRLIENLKYIIAAALAGMLIFAFYTFFLVVPTYEATSKIYVMSASNSAINLSDLQIGSYLTNDYQEVFKTWEVNESVITNLSLPYSYTELQNMLSVTNPGDTRILYITAQSADPKEAADIANEFASVARTYIHDTMSTEEPNILSVALVPDIPVKPNKTRNLILGFLLGGILASAVIAVAFLMDDRIKNADDLSKYFDMPTFAIIPIADMPKDTAHKRGKSGEASRRRV